METITLKELPKLNRGYIAALDLLLELFLKWGHVQIDVHQIEEKNLGSTIVAPNHFTRFEVGLIGKILFAKKGILPRYLADAGLFSPGFAGNFLIHCGALPTNIPNRNTIMAADLALGGTWVIFPEGSMIKDKRIYEDKKFIVYSYEPDNPYRPPRTGTAIIAMEAQKYKEEMRELFFAKKYDQLEEIISKNGVDPDTFYRNVFEDVSILPVNLSYFPRSNPNHRKIERLINHYMPKIDPKLREELIYDGALLTYGVDIDVRFEEPIRVKDYVNHPWLYRLRNVFSFKSGDFGEKDRERKRKKAFKIMQQYMRKIYYSTTVNINNIVSEIILVLYRDYQVLRLAVKQLRQMTYLVLNDMKRMEGIFLHRSLSERQGRIEFLYEKKIILFDQYLAFCQEKELLSLEDDTIIFAPTMLSVPDFQMIRLLNPIKVASNEIQPLTRVVQSIHAVCRRREKNAYPEFFEDLLGYEQELFEKDYLYFEQNQKLDKVFVGKRLLGAPKYLPSKSGPRRGAVLLIHGISACPQQMYELAIDLAGQGYHVYCVRLEGHGTSAHDLRNKTWQDWYHSVKRAFAMLKYLDPRVSIIGFAMGGLLGLKLAAEHSELTSVAVVSMPLDVATPLFFFANILRYVHPYVKLSFLDRQCYYSMLPMRTLAELRKLSAHVRGLLAQVSCPSLFMIGREDPRSYLQNPMALFDTIGSKRKNLVVVESTRSGKLNKQEHGEVFTMVERFLEKNRL